ncbi:hypothetical protein ACFV30_33845 [Streptomyces sp. NPDC059752]|uniref:hypothetical protein n=1 Tax=unclassified Streptomyces TaxID=2593676 RepID=UPI003648B46E
MSIRLWPECDVRVWACRREFGLGRDEARGADLITFSANEGLSVAWFGRTQAGELISIVVMGHMSAEALA